MGMHKNTEKRNNWNDEYRPWKLIYAYCILCLFCNIFKYFLHDRCRYQAYLHYGKIASQGSFSSEYHKKKQSLESYQILKQVFYTLGC